MITSPGDGVAELRCIHLHFKKSMYVIMRHDCLLEEETKLSVTEVANKLSESRNF